MLSKNTLLQTAFSAIVVLYIHVFLFKLLQEIDGHSLLLLTVQEIHHILGVRLGPAMKIHDLIYSLQQVVNEAYMASKNRVLSKVH